MEAKREPRPIIVTLRMLPLVPMVGIGTWYTLGFRVWDYARLGLILPLLSASLLASLIISTIWPRLGVVALISAGVGGVWGISQYPFYARLTALDQTPAIVVLLLLGVPLHLWIFRTESWQKRAAVVPITFILLVIADNLSQIAVASWTSGWKERIEGSEMGRLQTAVARMIKPACVPPLTIDREVDTPPGPVNRVSGTNEYAYVSIDSTPDGENRFEITPAKHRRWEDLFTPSVLPRAILARDQGSPSFGTTEEGTLPVPWIMGGSELKDN